MPAAALRADGAWRGIRILRRSRKCRRGACPGTAVPCWLISADRTFRLEEGQNIVGRDPGCAVWIDSPSVSRRHARITVESRGRRVVLEDLGSTNGCLSAVLPSTRDAPVRRGSITIGSVELKVYLWNAEGAARPHAFRGSGEGP